MISFCRFSVLLSAIVAIVVSETETITYTRVYEVVEEVQYEDGDPTYVETNIVSPKPVQPDDGFGVFTPAFNSIGGNIVDVSTRGKEVWAIKGDDSIHRFKNGQWKQIPGAAVNVGASLDGWAWVVNRAGKIYRFNANTQSWDNIPGDLGQISALSKDEALGANGQSPPATSVYWWKNGTWNPVPGWTLRWASIGQNDERWVIGWGDSIWRWDHQINFWAKQPGAAVTVDVHSPSRVVVMNKENQVYAWLPEQKTWKLLEGKAAKRATVGEGVLITLGLDGLLTAVKY